MQNTQKGFIVPAIIVVAVLVLGGGTYYFTQKSSVTETNNTDTSTNTQTATSSASTATVEVKTPVIETKTTLQTPVQTIVNTTVSVPVAVKKNTYTNTKAGYSIEFPETWSANVNSAVNDPSEPEITSTYLMIKGKTADEQGFSFDIQTATTKHHIDYYKQEYSKTPTNDELFNAFMETQKSSHDDVEVSNTRKTMINGTQAYEATATISGGGATARWYAFYTAKNTYYIQIIALTSEWAKLEPELLKVVASFKVQ